MSTFKKLEEIEVWQRARRLVGEVYSVSGRGQFSRDFALRDQIRRAAISIMSNIAEGFGRGGTREFIQFLSIAKGSVSEVMSHLYVAHDQGYLDTEKLDFLLGSADEVGRMIGALMNYLRHIKIKGSKYK